MPQEALHAIAYDGAPSVLVIADSDAGLERLQRSALDSGCRVSDAVRLGEAAARLERQVGMDAVLLSIAADHGPALDRVTTQLQQGAESGRYGSVVAAPFALIDAVFAGAPHSGIVQLCESTDGDLGMAIALATAREPIRLHDSGRGTARLQELSAEVGRIADALARLSEDGALADISANGQAEEPVSAGAVRAMIRERRLRERYFPGDLFADPAWDMLLDLMAARLEGQKVAVSSLCIAAAVPATTALRWIKTLTDHGLFVRVADPQDGRRVFIDLSEEAAARLAAYLAAVQRIPPLAI